MELYIQIIFVLAAMKFCLKAATTGRLWVIFIYAFAASLLSFAMYPIVIEQPLTIISDLLANKTVVTDIAVLTTIEAVAGIFVSIFLLDNYFMERSKRKRYVYALKVVPGIIFVFALAYFQLQFFKIRAGEDFLATALIYCSIIFGFVSLLSIAIKQLITAESLRLELKILLNIAILVIGLWINSAVADYNLSHAETTIEWGALIAISLILVSLFGLGYLLSKMNFKKINFFKKSH